MPFSRNVLLGVFATAGIACASAAAQSPTYNLGRTPASEELRAWDISIGPEGKELPPGSGTATEGGKIYTQKCAQCHGATGAEGDTNAPQGGRRDTSLGGAFPRLVGGVGSLATERPVRTVGSNYPVATTIWDYINRSMPMYQEGTLKPDEVYALTAFLLFRNGIIQETDIINAKSLPKIQMPNRDGFVPARPEWKKPVPAPVKK
ncbi:MAG TPA: cytochrome c [Terriglobia bacterium]|nr:cytochrome c [Terriglobia bacterium]